MKKVFLISIILLIIVFEFKAQTLINGMVVDSISKEPIGYVNIGVLENSNGTVSSPEGKFELKIKEKDKTIKFSSIGFERKT